MDMKKIKFLLRHPLKGFINSERIFLHSHMRSRSSVLSHIIGSSDEISGYSELSIRYSSKNSLLDQKVMLQEDGCPIKPGIKLFDKILHNDYEFDGYDYLNSQDVKNIIMIRDPVSTISSLVTMGLKNNNKQYSDVAWCVDYYINRANHLSELAKNLNSFYFIESDSIVGNTSTLLNNLSRFLDLQKPLSSNYNRFNKSGVKKHGDTSQNILKGEVVSTKRNEEIVIDEAYRRDLMSCFDKVVTDIKRFKHAVY